jgi:fermentation-respiration switch protein FrsA (DUF1100 family)
MPFRLQDRGNTPAMREDIEFRAEDGTTLRGWLYTPDDGAGIYPFVAMTHGIGAVKEMYTDLFAEAFCAAGIVTLLYDVRGCGASDGLPRHEYDPWKQVSDYRDAITFAHTLEQVDADRIGIFGTSFSGGHVLAIAALDKRVKAVVAQVPFVSGFQTTTKLAPADALPPLFEALDADRLARYHGESPAMMALVDPDPAVPSLIGDVYTAEWYERVPREDLANWVNTCTLRTLQLVREYEPGLFAKLISPIPLLMIVASHDTLTPTVDALEVYDRALEPKSLIILPGDHYVAYEDRREEALAGAVDWFSRHLVDGRAGSHAGSPASVA